jgi:hypothetical protein
MVVYLSASLKDLEDSAMKHSRRVLLGLSGTAAVLLALLTFAHADSLVVLLEGLGGRVTSSGIVSLQEELSAIPNTIVALPLAQHSWRDAVKLIKQQKPETKIVVIGYSLGANNSTYVAQNVKHVDELIAIQASVWGRATPVGENVDKAIEIYNPKFWRTAGLGAKRLVGIHFSYVANSDSHFYADDDPEVHNFVFNEVKKLADPTAPAKSVFGIQPERCRWCSRYAESEGGHDLVEIGIRNSRASENRGY